MFHFNHSALAAALVLFAFTASAAEDGAAPDIPEGFAFLDEAIPGLELDLRYTTNNNFVGAPIDGYEHGRAVLSVQAAEALNRVQAYLETFGLGLKVFDAYRPQRAVDHFVRWAADLDDERTKSRFYPEVPKSELFERGYIAERSSHSRGSAVDVTIVFRTEDGSVVELDMGSPYDYFDSISWPDSSKVTPVQRANRALLQRVMQSEGFSHYPQEWWHFTLRDEPFPDTYFDFPDTGSRE